MLGDTNTENFIKNLLDKNIRLDGRQVFQTRNVNIEFLDKFGCLLYSQGKTQVLIKTSTEIVMPKPERPAEGFVFFRVNCMVCPYSFDQNKKNSNQITKLLEKVIVGSNCLDPQSLCILTGKFVWQITIDCIVVQDCGNIIDAILNGTIAALMDMKKPLLNVKKTQVTICQKQLPLSLAHTPLSLSFGIFGNCLFIDPSLQQQACEQTRITVSMNVYNEICSIHKPGGKGITQHIMSGILKVCEKKIREMTNNIREAVQVRKSIRQTF